MMAHNSQSCLLNSFSRVDAILSGKLFLVFCQTRHLPGTRDIKNNNKEKFWYLLLSKQSHVDRKIVNYIMTVFFKVRCKF